MLLNYVSKDKMTLIRCLSVKAVNEAKSFEQDFFQNKLNLLETRGIASIYAHTHTHTPIHPHKLQSKSVIAT